jgi:hypothetical protein
MAAGIFRRGGQQGEATQEAELLCATTVLYAQPREVYAQ